MIRNSLILLGLFLCVFSQSFVLAQGKTVSLEEALSGYKELKRKDPEVRDLKAWENAASVLLKFLDSDRARANGDKALFALAELYQETYDKRKFGTGLTRAVYFYEQLAKEYPNTPLADDALLVLGDLRRNVLQDEVAARAAYYEIVDRYKSGDKYAEARKRLGLSELQAGAGKPTKTELAVKKPPTKPVKEEGGELLSLFPSSRTETKSREVFSQSDDRTRPLIVIDPGHGGDDHGAIGVDGVMEKDVVLNIAIYLEELLRERLRARTLLTRVRDIAVPLPDRTKLANDNNADLFVSVHANASELKNATGVETYYLDNTDDKSSLKLAERENSSLGDAEKLGDVSFIFSDLIQNAKLDDSIALAHHLQQDMVQMLGRYYQGVRNLGVKKAPFYVLVGAHMPCVLTEVAFIDHPLEGRRLIEPRYQRLVADALYRGIRSYFEKKEE